MIFSQADMRSYAFPAVVEAGRICFEAGKVREVQAVGDSFIGSVVHGNGRYRIVLSPQPNSRKFATACNCGFSYGGACEHAVAVMLALNNREVLQTSLLLVPGEPKTGQPSSLTPAPRPSAPPPSPAPPPAPVEPRPAAPAAVEAEGEDGEVVTLSPKPVGRLYLSEREGMLFVELRFGYHGGMAEFCRYDINRERLVPAPDGTVYRIVRSKLREDLMTEKLNEENLSHYRTGTFVPLDSPAEWIRSSLPNLAVAGFEIYGKENLRTSLTHEHHPRLKLSVASAGEGVNCLVAVDFNGIPAPLSALATAARAGSRYVLLSDGSTGVLPQQWLETFARLFSAYEDQPERQLSDRLSVNRYQLSLLDELFGLADEVEAGDAVRNQLQALKNFQGIKEQAAPEGFRGTMRPYQLAGYTWFYFLQHYRFGGCLADDMGLGKTVQTLALLLNEKHRQSDHRPTLIMVPASLLFNWDRECRHFTPGLQLLVYHGPNRHRYAGTPMLAADIVLTTYGTILRDIERLQAVRFHYVILDEAQAIKNPASHISRSIRKLQARHRLALTGTPIENSLYELWSLFTFLNPGMLGSLRHFSTNFIQPVSRDPQAPQARVLRKLVFPFILRRTKEQVARDLPPKTENLLFCEMLPRQRTLYEIVRDTYRSRILSAIERDGIEKSEMHILEGLLRLRQICCHPLLADEHFTGESGKFSLLDTFIEEAVGGGHKILLFSNFVTALELLRRRLDAKAIRSVTLTGQTANRQAVVDRFQTDPATSVFLISLKAGGTGLNLTAADYVIHLEPWWNPAIERQASDRAYRIGQTRPVFVYKMITQASIEERVLQLQERKKELVDAVIEAEGSYFKKLTRDDIEALFT